MSVIEGGGFATPVTVLTGFLGAGKTTLLNRILTGDHGLRVGVLVNDFGAINIDAELVVGIEGGAISLANGCVCCQIRDDLIEAVATLLARPERVEYVILEASGVADPAGIFSTFSDASLRDRIRLDSVTCVVDAEQVFAHPEYPPLMDLKLRQVGFADMLILNKVGVAGPLQVAKVRAWLDEHFNRLRIIETDFCDAPLEVLLGVGRFEAPSSAGEACTQEGCNEASHNHAHAAADMFATWSWENDQPVLLGTLREKARRLPGSIYRAKGVIHAAEAPDRRAVLQVVGRRVDISLQEPWGLSKPLNRIVAIGAVGGIDASLLNETFTACLAARPAAR